MKLTLKRIDTNDYGVFGHLTIDSSPFNCVTLERHDIAVPVGIYKITMYESPGHGCIVPLLNNVPGRSFIEIHWGNYEKDSKGCILVGTIRNGESIENSRIAFDGLMTALKGADDVSIAII